MAVLDLVEAVMKRLVANRGARLACLEAMAMQLVVVVGMLRAGLAPDAAIKPTAPTPRTPNKSRRSMVFSLMWN